VTNDATPGPKQIPRETLYARLRRTAGTQVVIVGVLFALALFHFGTRQHTSATLEGVVPTDARLVAQQTLGDVHALLIEPGDAFQLLMAYQARDGWVALHVPQPPAIAEYALEDSMGHPPVPAFTAVYGRLRGALPGAGAMVRIFWLDGPRDVPLVDGGFIEVREGRFVSDRVSLVDRGGAIVRDLVR
jgi:hypothetical protein